MHGIYELRDRLMKELEEHAGREKFDRTALSDIFTVSGAVKNLNRIIENAEQGEYSGARGYMGSDYSYRRDSMGRYARDGYMGAGRNVSGTTYRGYSRHGDLMEKVQAMMADEGMRRELQEMVERAEQR